PPGAVPPQPSTSASPSPSTSSPAMVDMKPTGADNGLTASIMVTGDLSGTRVDGTCIYKDSNPYAEAGNYSLWILTTSDKTVQIESWHALPGSKVTLVAQTWWPKDQIKRIEMHDSTGQVVLYYDL